ncbi:MAG: ABC transporter substrate-binding protein [Armatimonadota bacterium]|nr:ABC transporter substrate-binding protein [Armatimonadota bacterium]
MKTLRNLTLNRNLKSLLASVVAVLGASLSLAGCSDRHSAALHGKYGGTLELVGGDDIRSLDPAVAYDLPAWGVERTLYSGLLDYDDKANLIPMAATRWEISPDGKTYTFHLRHDMHFEGPLTHNRLVTSQDFAYEIGRVLDPKTGSSGFDFFSTILGADAFKEKKSKTVSGLVTPDLYTLVVHLKAPKPEFLNIMAMPFAYAVPHEVVEKYGAADFPEHAESYGPFKLGFWRRNVDIQLDRNPHYWIKGVPFLDHIHERFGMGDLNSMMMFETGELGLSSIPPPDFVRITHNPKFANLTVKQPAMTIYYLSMNCEMPPFNDVRVRQAVNYAINRERVLKLLNNRGALATGVLPPGMPGADDPTLKGYSYDPAKARQLLKEAGHPEGFSSVLWVRSSDGAGTEMQQAQSIQQDLEAVGIHVQLKPVTFSVWLTAVSKEGHVPMSMNRWVMDFPDPSDFLDVLLNSKQARKDEGNNNAFYKSPAMDALLNRAGSMLDPAKRLDLYRQANRLAVHDAPWVFLYYPVDYQLHQPWVHGFKLHPVWPALYEKIWLSG